MRVTILKVMKINNWKKKLALNRKDWNDVTERAKIQINLMSDEEKAEDEEEEKKRRIILHAMNQLKMFKNIRMPEQEEDIGRRFITKINND